jgi:hypothetical protein
MFKKTMGAVRSTGGGDCEKHGAKVLRFLSLLGLQEYPFRVSGHKFDLSFLSSVLQDAFHE